MSKKPPALFTWLIIVSCIYFLIHSNSSFWDVFDMYVELRFGVLKCSASCISPASRRSSISDLKFPWFSALELASSLWPLKPMPFIIDVKKALYSFLHFLWYSVLNTNRRSSHHMNKCIHPWFWISMVFEVDMFGKICSGILPVTTANTDKIICSLAMVGW